LHVINGCNLRCFYCYIPHLESRIDPAEVSNHSLSDETAECVIRRLLEFCRVNRFTRLHIKFAGGEPTLNLPVIENFCRSATTAARDIRLSFGMISNGSFAVKDVQPLLARYNINLSISIDGFKDYHDQVRFVVLGDHRIGTWSMIEQNIQALLGFGIKPYILSTVTKRNAPSLQDFAYWAHSLGLGFRLSPVRLRQAPSELETEMIASQISSLYSWLGTTMPTSLNFERDARFAEWNLHKKKFNACGSCRNYIAVTEAGEIRSCQMSPSSPFNVHGHTINEALIGFQRHPNTATLAQPMLKNGACTKCEYYHVCSGGCPQHTLAVYGSTQHPSPWCKVFGEIAPVYIKAKATHLRRQLDAVR